MRQHYKFAEHITLPRPCWHENPVLVLARQLQHMDLADQITAAGKMVRKTWSQSRGTRYVVYEADGQSMKAYKSVLAASERVYEEVE